ncbi:MaoC family dehydratase [Dietzia psychralcaliphila]|uniref:MaoC family dehydratase n=1 Tax=Dietzia psychralcaliphila TaxID=139021 RepID=UPI001C1DF9C1|nr:MaoC family dehydratase [Dietzia psychralcaliphila]
MPDIIDPATAPAGVTVYRGIDELVAAVGDELGPTEWLPMEQARIDAFADATDDHQWIHVDPSRAAESPYGATIAHGFLTLSLLPHFMSSLRRFDGVRMGINYGLDKARFPAAVPSGTRIRGRMSVDRVEPLSDDGVQLTTTVTIEAEGSEKPACVATLLSRYYFHPATAAVSTQTEASR